MTRLISLIPAGAGLFMILSCAGSPAKPDETAALRAENQNLNSQIDTLNEKIMSLTAEVSNYSEFKGANSATYSNLIKDLRDQLASKESTVKQLEDSVKVTFVNDIFFDEGSDVIKSEGIKALDNIAITLATVKDRMIRVEGYTDNMPITPGFQWKFPSNWELSTARAGSVVRYLVGKGVKPEMLKAAGYSKYNPVASNDTPEGRAQNRRIVIELVQMDSRAKYK